MQGTLCSLIYIPYNIWKIRVLNTEAAGGGGVPALHKERGLIYQSVSNPQTECQVASPVSGSPVDGWAGERASRARGLRSCLVRPHSLKRTACCHSRNPPINHDLALNMPKRRKQFVD